MQMKKLILFLITFLFFSACSSAVIKQDTGDTAHDFTLPNQKGKMITLSTVLTTHRGAVIAFYPKDDSKN